MDFNSKLTSSLTLCSIMTSPSELIIPFTTFKSLPCYLQNLLDCSKPMTCSLKTSVKRPVTMNCFCSPNARQNHLMIFVHSGFVNISQTGLSQLFERKLISNNLTYFFNERFLLLYTVHVSIVYK